MDYLLPTLAVACCLQAVALVVLGAVVPLLAWRVFRLEADLAKLDRFCDRVGALLTAEPAEGKP